MVLAAAGCGGPKLVPVSGKVQYQDGRAVTAASICFLPDTAKGNGGILATSLLAEDGTFTLRTHPHGQGAMLGPYKVTVSLGRAPKALAKYTRAQSTPFHVEVPPEGLRDLVFTLR
jgi:hypothetical protein